ncbi:MAG: hypothetical protein IKI94_02860, partial [Ruminococcus sp.]|nr:hypothetical protein [Ruminococcus sp.]
MSIFNFNKNSVSFSRDWELFQKFMGNIGAFTYIANEKTAYMDPVTCRLLNCSHEKINEWGGFGNMLSDGAAAAAEADITVLALGLDCSIEGEDTGFDNDYT